MPFRTNRATIIKKKLNNVVHKQKEMLNHKIQIQEKGTLDVGCWYVGMLHTGFWMLMLDEWGMRYALWGMRYEVCVVRYQVWGIRYEVWGMKYEVWGMRYEVWSLKYEVWSMKYEVWGYAVWSIRYEESKRWRAACQTVISCLFFILDCLYFITLMWHLTSDICDMWHDISS